MTTKIAARLSGILMLFNSIAPAVAQTTDIITPTPDNLFMADVIHLSTSYSEPAAQAIMSAGRAKVIQDGHQVCSLLEEGVSLRGIQMSMVKQLAKAGVSRQEFSEVWNPYMSAVMVSAVTHFCPQHENLV